MKPNRQAVHAKYKGHCAYCGDEISIKDMQVDHVICQRNYELNLKNKHKIPYWLKHLTLSDLNHIDNLMPACRSCNKFKDIFSLETFREEIEQQINRLREHKPTFRLAERYRLIKCQPQRVIFYFEMCDAQPRFTPDTLPVLGSEVIAYDQAGDPHRMSVTETWAMRMFDCGYTEWAELPNRKGQPLLAARFN